MLALSPPLFSTTHGWALEDLITQNLAHEANSYNPLVDFHIYDQIKQDLAREDSISSGEATTSGTGDDMKVAKKLNHNVCERERRKKVNELYGFLRSLLPISSDEKKKLSIPRTISRVLKYIPELQKEVDEMLRHKKEKLSLYSTANTTQGRFGIKKRSSDDTTLIKTKSSVVSSVTSLGEKEAIIQLVSSLDQMNKNNEINLVSKMLEYLEQEEDELVLINATNFKCSSQGMSISTLHIRVQGDYKLEAETLKEKLRAFQ